jgi:ABC-type xylose transport system permease subunit
MEAAMLVKPSYSTSRLYLWISFALAWVVILVLAIGAIRGSEQAVAFGATAVPSMVMLIAAILGIHRGFGSVDMKTAASIAPQPSSPEGGA